MRTAIIVCYNHADYLNQSLKFNDRHYDRVLVATDPNDEINDYKCLELVKVPELAKTNNKGQAINAALELVTYGWITIMDADVVMPYSVDMADMIFDNLREDTIYGTDRLDVCGWDQWQQVKGQLSNPDPEAYTQINAPLMKRYYFRGEGWAPIGFWQTFHSSCGKRYRDDVFEAGKTDAQFAMQWPRSRRGFIPEATVLHLSTPDAQRADNWYGRKTAPFRAEKKPEQNAPAFGGVLYA